MLPYFQELSPLSEAIWREEAPTEFVGDVSARLTWQDLTVMVSTGDGETRNVLEGLTGYAEPGTLTALMGPSTLLLAASPQMPSSPAPFFLTATKPNSPLEQLLVIS